ncbi:olfactory receptor 52K1-like [Genypterus blacodes]|uniref:olfactory receptor 52K1-like n=1 Tax=Genypterus blacodes TaxID=154954 RepID=UPI003F770BE3
MVDFISLHEPMYLFLCSLFVNELYGSIGLFPLLLVQILSDVHTVSTSFCFLQIFWVYSYGNLCGNIIDKVYCDNFPVVRLACYDTSVNNIYGMIYMFTIVFGLSRFNMSGIPIILRIFLSLYFLTSPPLFNPLVYGLNMADIKKSSPGPLLQPSDRP